MHRGGEERYVSKKSSEDRDKEMERSITNGEETFCETSQELQTILSEQILLRELLEKLYAWRRRQDV